MSKYPMFRIIFIVLLVYFIKIALFSNGEALPPIQEKLLNFNVTPPIDTLYPEIEISYIEKDQTLGTLFNSSGLKRNESAEILNILKSIYPGSIYEGQEYILHKNQDSTLKMLILYSRDKGIRYKIARENGHLTAGVCTIPLTKKVSTLTGTLNTSLYGAIEKAGEKPELIFKLIDVFSWDINWFIDPREGDTFKIVYEKYYYGDRFIRYGDMLAALYITNGQTYSAYLYNPDSTLRGYFNAEGVSLQKTFLKAPLTYRRISSGFSLSRLHPVLNKWRPHLGIDYAAPSGTPVKAAGNGRVVSAGIKGGYGKCIKLEHGNGYSSYYGHLSKFASCLKAKCRVKQGDVIGYVGATGLATGPHLDYRISRSGKFINPLTLKSEPMKRVPGKFMNNFIALKTKWDSELGSVSSHLYASTGRP